MYFSHTVAILKIRLPNSHLFKRPETETCTRSVHVGNAHPGGTTAPPLDHDWNWRKNCGANTQIETSFFSFFLLTEKRVEVHIWTNTL